MKKKNGSILKQLAIPLTVIFTIVSIINAVFLYTYSLQTAINDRVQKGQEIGKCIAGMVEQYECFHFLIDYWDEHCDDMEPVYDEEVYEEKAARFSKMMPSVIDISLITDEQAYALDDEAQELLAQLCQASISEDFNRYKKAFDVVFLTCFNVIDGQRLYYATGVNDDEKRVSQGGDVYDFGTRSEYTYGVYPILDELLETSEAPTDLELSRSRGADDNYVHYFYPVFDDGAVACVVGVSLYWRDVVRSTLTPTIIIFLVSTLMLACLLVFCFRILRVRLVDPLQHECRVIESYESKKNSAHAKSELARIKTGNELDRITASFSSMVGELDRYMEEIRSTAAEKANLETEMGLAVDIQCGVLPDKFPVRSDMVLFASMTPAKDVGGDFYDFFMIDEDHIALVVGDVSGKGVPAALFMMMSSIVIRGFAKNHRDPAKALAEANNEICRNNNEEMFVTAWLGILDLRTGILKAANAGHEYPFVKHAGGSFEKLDDEHGFILGGLENMVYHTYEVKLEPGASVFVYTDGLPEASDSSRSMFGTDRIGVSLNRDPDSSPEALIERMSADVNEFVADAPQFDDLTMLCLEYRGREAVTDGQEEPDGKRGKE